MADEAYREVLEVALAKIKARAKSGQHNCWISGIGSRELMMRMGQDLADRGFDCWNDNQGYDLRVSWESRDE